MPIEHMDWYLQKDGDLIVPNDQETLEVPCAEDRSPLPSDWCHWGFIRPEKFKSHNIYSGRSTKSAVEEFDFDRQSRYVQVSKGPSVHEGEGSNSCARGEPSSVDCSARTLEASFYCHPDSHLQTSMDWMDEIFLNSLLEEDYGNMENPFQTLNIPDSTCRSLSFENPLTNMLIDPQSLMKDPARREASVSTCSIPLLTNGTSESWVNQKNPGLTVLMPGELSVSNQSEVVADADEPNCLEAMVLQEIEDIMIHQLSENMRICFRDALYRLSKSSKGQYAINQNSSTNFIDRPSFAAVNSESPSRRRSQYGESKTNVIDRAIANLMFNKPYCHGPDFPCTHSSTENLSSPGSYYSLEQAYYYRGLT